MGDPVQQPAVTAAGRSRTQFEATATAAAATVGKRDSNCAAYCRTQRGNSTNTFATLTTTTADDSDAVGREQRPAIDSSIVACTSAEPVGIVFELNCVKLL